MGNGKSQILENIRRKGSSDLWWYIKKGVCGENNDNKILDGK